MAFNCAAVSTVFATNGNGVVIVKDYPNALVESMMPNVMSSKIKSDKMMVGDVHKLMRCPVFMSITWSMPSTDKSCVTAVGVPLVNDFVTVTVCPISIGAKAVFWASVKLANVVDTLVKRGFGIGYSK